jgi:hypothetical protein
MWGSYFGEVVRRRFGGDWSIETYLENSSPRSS